MGALVLLARRARRVAGVVGEPQRADPAAPGWDETTTNWSNQPAWNPTVLGRSATPAAPGWLSISLPTSSVTAGGDSAFALDYSVAGMIERVASRESPIDPPQLVVTTTPAPVTTALTPAEDTYLYAGAPAATNGSATPLLCSAGSYRALLRFDTSWLSSGNLVSAVSLRLYATVGLSSGGIRVHPEAGGWNEPTTSWSNQPAWNTQVLATTSTTTAPGWVTVDLPPSAVIPGGNTDFGLDYSVAGMIERIASREDATHPPQLLITAS